MEKYKKGLPNTVVEKIIIKLVSALKVIHENDLVHADLKPENILIKTPIETHPKYKKLILKISEFNFHKRLVMGHNKLSKKNKKNWKMKKKIVISTVRELLDYIKFILADDSDSKSSINSNFSDDDIINFINTTKEENKEQTKEDNDEDNKEDNKEHTKEREEEEEKTYDGCSEEDKIDRYEIFTTSEKSNDIEEEISSEKINEEELENCEIYISDFGSCNNINKINFEIMTRYYRAPEILIQYNPDKMMIDNKTGIIKENEFRKACDIWALGCIIYEIVSGELLFNPDKYDLCHRDRVHLSDIISKTGIITLEMIKKSKLRSIFFTTKGLLKGVRKMEIKKIKIENKYSNIIRSILNMCLKVDLKERSKIEDIQFFLNNKKE